MRLDKFLANYGLGSRKEVKKFLKEGLVKVNGKVVKQASTKIDPDHDNVQFLDQIIEFQEDVYYMLHKPEGYICSHEGSLYPSVLELIDDLRSDLIMVGRLDVDTEGLLLISNDGQFAHQVAHGKKDVKKKYYIELEKTMDQKCIPDLEEGILLDGEKTKAAKVEMIDEKRLYLSISEGKYHQVKRMMHYCDNEVKYLKRVQIGDLKLDPSLDLGEYRALKPEEIELFIEKN